jgi:hypothetical protein
VVEKGGRGGWFAHSASPQVALWTILTDKEFRVIEFFSGVFSSDQPLNDLYLDAHGVDHFHLMPESRAANFDGDGFSDAVEARLRTDPYDPTSHPCLDASWFGDGVGTFGASSHSDRDGFPDGVEIQMGTNPLSELSHPDVTLAHHFPAGSDINLPGTIDIAPPVNSYWTMP